MDVISSKKNVPSQHLRGFGGYYLWNVSHVFEKYTYFTAVLLKPQNLHQERENVWRHQKLVQKSTWNGVRQVCLHLLSSLSSCFSPVETDVCYIWWQLKWLKMKILKRTENLVCRTRSLSLSCSEHCKVTLPLVTSSSLDRNRATLVELGISKTMSS